MLVVHMYYCDSLTFQACYAIIVKITQVVTMAKKFKVRLGYNSFEGTYIFTILEPDAKITDFFRKLKAQCMNKRATEWRIPVYEEMELDGTPVYKAQFAYTKLIKHTEVRPGVHINKLNLEKPGLSSPDGYTIKLVYDRDSAQSVCIRNGWVDPKTFVKKLSDMGFKHDRVAWAADANYQLIKWLQDIEATKLLVVEESFVKLSARLARLQSERIDLADNFHTMYRENALYAGGKKAFKHQSEYFESRCDWGNYLALDMGLGKTWTALYSASIYKRYMDLHVIVLCPRSVKQNWIKTATEEFGLHIAAYTTASIPEPHHISGNYILIADEAHFAADPRSQRTKAYLKLAYNAHAVINLSGTACTNGRPSDLFAQLKAIGFAPAFDVREYQNKYGWDDPLRPSSMAQLAEELGSKYFYRHATQCLDLPKLSRTKHWITLSAEEEKVFTDRFNEFMEVFRERQAAGIVGSGFDQFVELQGLRLSLAKAKAQQTAELLHDIVKHGHQCAVYSDFVESIETVAAYCEYKGISFEWMTASDGDAERYDKQKRFQNNEVSVFLCTYRCGGVGIELTPCDRMILLDRPWSPAMVTQCEKRIARIGQTKPVLIYWAYWQDPEDIEEKIEQIIMKKQDSIDKLNGFNTDLSMFEGAKLEAIDVEAVEAVNYLPYSQ